MSQWMTKSTQDTKLRSRAPPLTQDTGRYSGLLRGVIFGLGSDNFLNDTGGALERDTMGQVQVFVKIMPQSKVTEELLVSKKPP